MGRNADAIAEGVAIALAAARLQVKNRILVSTISLGENFDPDHFAPVAREALSQLADEQEQVSESMTAARKRAWGRHSQPHGTHDYRDRDVRNLRRRAKQAAGVAKRLRDRMDDPAQLRELVEAARDAAWGDVQQNLDRRLQIEGMRPDQDPDYARMRDARMQALRLVDLQRLSADARARRRADQQEQPAQEGAAESS
ncbi:asparagine synthase [Microbacterium sp. Marseille-Q6965]|uniref:asparagine synthase n=1 Tax=Microbacterium sp. Marseille-Q6965 TaxID=2965072 RepID=UPI0021B773FC|nr:asparagine synthase [Microbacterium sp. Marseille-Q6965]